MTTTGSSRSLAEQYMHSILGQQTPLPISHEDIVTATAENDESSTDNASFFLQLLRVDSVFNGRQTDEAKTLLSTLDIDKIKQDNHAAWFQQGLHALLEGTLTDAYDCFVRASHHATTSGLEAVFYGERAVNVSWMLECSI